MRLLVSIISEDSIADAMADALGLELLQQLRCYGRKSKLHSASDLRVDDVPKLVLIARSQLAGPQIFKSSFEMNSSGHSREGNEAQRQFRFGLGFVLLGGWFAGSGFGFRSTTASKRAVVRTLDTARAP
jgi:hypothetical protein